MSAFPGIWIDLRERRICGMGEREGSWGPPGSTGSGHGGRTPLQMRREICSDGDCLGVQSLLLTEK